MDNSSTLLRLPNPKIEAALLRKAAVERIGKRKNNKTAKFADDSRFFCHQRSLAKVSPAIWQHWHIFLFVSHLSLGERDKETDTEWSNAAISSTQCMHREKRKNISPLFSSSLFYRPSVCVGARKSLRLLLSDLFFVSILFSLLVFLEEIAFVREEIYGTCTHAKCNAVSCSEVEKGVGGRFVESYLLNWEGPRTRKSLFKAVKGETGSRYCTVKGKIHPFWDRIFFS